MNVGRNGAQGRQVMAASVTCRECIPTSARLREHESGCLTHPVEAGASSHPAFLAYSGPTPSGSCGTPRSSLCPTRLP